MAAVDVDDVPYELAIHLMHIRLHSNKLREDYACIGKILETIIPPPSEMEDKVGQYHWKWHEMPSYEKSHFFSRITIGLPPPTPFDEHLRGLSFFLGFNFDVSEQFDLANEIRTKISETADFECRMWDIEMQVTDTVRSLGGYLSGLRSNQELTLFYFPKDLKLETRLKFDNYMQRVLFRWGRRSHSTEPLHPIQNDKHGWSQNACIVNSTLVPNNIEIICCALWITWADDSLEQQSKSLAAGRYNDMNEIAQRRYETHKLIWADLHKAERDQKRKELFAKDNEGKSWCTIM